MSARMLVLAVLAATLVVLTGCSSTGDAPSRSAGDSGNQAIAPDTGERAAAGDEAQSAADLPGPGLRRIRRAEMTLEVSDLQRAAAQVSDVAAALHGYVSGQSFGAAPVDLPQPAGDTSAEEPPFEDAVALAPDNPPGEGRLVLRVPSDSLADSLDRLASLGRELNRWSAETEVEGALVDLESRVASQTASVQRLRALLDRATSVSDVVAVESELARREADLESLKGRLQSLSDRAAMATVTVVLRTPERTELTAGGFLAGLRAGWTALAESVVVLLTVLGAVLPFAAVAALAAVPLTRWWRRRAKARTVAASGG